jgi:hypothetical protein
MEPTFLILVLLVALSAMLWTELTGTKKEIRALDQKVNVMLRQLGIDPSTIDSSEATIRRLAGYTGMESSKKPWTLRKKNLMNPDEFKKAWQECQKAAGEE